MKLVVDTEFIRSFMKVKGLGEPEFASKIGITHSMLNRVLNGKRNAGNKVIFGITHSMLNRVLNGKRNAGNKVIFGMLSAYKELKVEQFCSYDQQLPKGNKQPKTA